ncbi:MAG TPA: rhodanese-like domain-containing protein [Geobacteraceae bacterium]|nr:rhodanese-like domain-containing protein [Geobacteraceae bacterium]
MKWIVSVIFLLTVTATQLFAASARDISSQEAKALLEKNRKVFILDVRTPDERRQGYIAGSTLIPIDAMEKRGGEVPKNRPVLVYCAVGSRSRVVAQALARQGYGEVYNMRDGILGWYRNGFAIQR